MARMGRSFHDARMTAGVWEQILAVPNEECLGVYGYEVSRGQARGLVFAAPPASR